MKAGLLGELEGGGLGCLRDLKGGGYLGMGMGGLGGGEGVGLLEGGGVLGNVEKRFGPGNVARIAMERTFFYFRTYMSVYEYENEFSLRLSPSFLVYSVDEGERGAEADNLQRFFRLFTTLWCPATTPCCLIFPLLFSFVSL